MKAAIIRGSDFSKLIDALMGALPHFGLRLTAHVRDGGEDRFLVLSKRRELTETEVDALLEKEISDDPKPVPLDVLLQKRDQVKTAINQGEIESLREGIYFLSMTIKWGLFDGEKLVQLQKQLADLTAELERKQK